MKNDNEDR